MSGQQDSALVYARKAVEMDADYVEAWNNLGIIYGDMAEYDSAIVAFERVLELDSTNFSAANNLGILYSDMEEFPEALRYFEIALRIAPGEGQANAVRDHITQIRVRGYR
jgi:tetratricopeptide (TPR) repeat protein